MGELAIDQQLSEWVREDCARLGASERLTDELSRSLSERLLINYGMERVYVRGRKCRGVDYEGAKSRYQALLCENGDVAASRDLVMREFGISSATFYRRVVGDC